MKISIYQCLKWELVGESVQIPEEDDLSSQLYDFMGFIFPLLCEEN